LSEGHWRFNEFRCPPGEVYFDAGEAAAIARWGMPRPLVIEPTVKDMGACVGANKQWPNRALFAGRGRAHGRW
jgi:hypothetical protein